MNKIEAPAVNEVKEVSVPVEEPVEVEEEKKEESEGETLE